MGLWDGPTSGQTLSYQSRTHHGHPAVLDREKATPGKIPKTLPGAKKCNKTMGAPKSAQPEGGRRPLKEPQEGKVAGCQEFGLIRARRAGRAGWYQAPSGLEMEPGPSRCSQGAATSKGSRAHPCPSHIPSPPQSCGVPPMSVGSTRNRSHRNTRLVSPAVTTTLHPWFPGKSIKSLSMLGCKLRGNLSPFLWPQTEYEEKRRSFQSIPHHPLPTPKARSTPGTCCFMAFNLLFLSPKSSSSGSPTNIEVFLEVSFKNSRLCLDMSKLKLFLGRNSFPRATALPKTLIPHNEFTENVAFISHKTPSNSNLWDEMQMRPLHMQGTPQS